MMRYAFYTYTLECLACKFLEEMGTPKKLLFRLDDMFFYIEFPYTYKLEVSMLAICSAWPGQDRLVR